VWAPLNTRKFGVRDKSNWLFSEFGGTPKARIYTGRNRVTVSFDSKPLVRKINNGSYGRNNETLFHQSSGKAEWSAEYAFPSTAGSSDLFWYQGVHE
jgi:hypothetical protein